MEGITILFSKEYVTAEYADDMQEIVEQSCLGTKKGTKVHFSLLEALYLIEKGKAQSVDGRGKPLTEECFIRKATRQEPNFWIRYCVFRNLRNRGYIVKTALKFGADFRVYDRGVRPGEDHARWMVFPVHESSTLTWHEFASKNRVAHSTRKMLLIGIVDDEDAITYYEIRWMRP